MPRHADFKTDTIIQTSLRTELRNDVTLITVAHRLQTIIDADKVVRVPSFSYTMADF
jgi:ABC-type multidrug transport system fused ATPase/permease subunit